MQIRKVSKRGQGFFVYRQNVKKGQGSFDNDWLELSAIYSPFACFIYIDEAAGGLWVANVILHYGEKVIPSEGFEGSTVDVAFEAADEWACERVRQEIERLIDHWHSAMPGPVHDQLTDIANLDRYRDETAEPDEPDLFILDPKIDIMLIGGELYRFPLISDLEGVHMLTDEGTIKVTLEKDKMPEMQDGIYRLVMSNVDLKDLRAKHE